jgi:YrbI family 3-deoxy-D-manno-octulosonate 8-phosphate phosphatase|tara:strand:+ start:231 stop:683 length:453 start_codon:yes stop_codon:yes gene_type:complete
VISAVFLDIDGVLTDGAVYVDASGKESKRILFDDIDAIFKMKRVGIKIGFITGEDNDFCQYVKNRFAPDYFIVGCKDKLAAFKKLAEENNLDKNTVCYAGDAERDMELLKYVARSFVPNDVSSEIKSSAKTVLKASRGQGVIKELSNLIL